MKDPKTVTIKILVDNGDVKCDPDSARAQYQDMIKWKCKNEFEVDFGIETPFESNKYRANKEEANVGKGDRVTYKKAKETGKSKKFKYIVTVWNNEEPLKADPDLEIMP